MVAWWVALLIAWATGCLGFLLGACLSLDSRADQTSEILRGLRKPTWSVRRARPATRDEMDALRRKTRGY